MRLNKEELYDADLIMDLYEERAAIIQYDGGYPRELAAHMAATALGFQSKGKLLTWVKDLRKGNHNYV